MHEFTPEVQALAAEVLAYSLDRLKNDPPLDGPRTAEDLFSEVGNTITARGLGGHEALEVFTSVLAKACISTDHPRNLAFIPSAPSEYANLFDLVVGASALYGGSWQEGAGLYLLKTKPCVGYLIWQNCQRNLVEFLCKVELLEIFQR